MNKVIIVIIILVVAGGGAFAYFLLPGILASSETYSEIREVTLPSSSVDTLVIESDINEIAVAAGENTEEIRAVGELQVNLGEEKGKETFEKQFVMVLSKRGSRAALRISYNTGILDHFAGKNAYLYVTVYLPPGVEGEIHPGKGDLYIGNVKNDISVEYSQGETVIEDVRGRIHIIDEAGSISLSRIQGDVWIRDEKGDIEIREVSGNVEIEDTAGGIDVDMVKGDLSITGRGKGDVKVRSITGSLNINN